MQLKKTWKKTIGCEQLIKKGESTLELLEFDLLRLEKGMEYSYDTGDWEYALVILGGSCTVMGDDFVYENIGSRRDVFSGPATSVYIPRKRTFTIRALNEVRIAVVKSPSDLDTKPVLVRPEDVIIKTLGKPGWKRDAHFIIDERIAAKHLYIGEAYVYPGNWASYPPHKHDRERMPQEGILEEGYYYEFNLEAGFGIQKVYTEEGDIDEIYTVRSGDLVEIPRGYHPFACAPGYFAYYLWFMAGENRGFFMSTEPAHKWITALDVILDKQ
ncbi:MAG: 5-deoxy-glucuronate isomerase [Firmicutes bacterium]|nr:5-deoxy-glucuronate isomerase [Bacillota bacterium]